jgi:alkaline phosphatase
MRFYQTISIALFALFLFPVYAQKKPPPDPNKPTSIVLILANGMGTAHLNAAMIESPIPLNIKRFSYSGLVSNKLNGSIVPDEGVLLNVLSTGILSNYGAAGMDKNQIPVQNILEYATERKRFTGLITTADITDIVPAAFYAHQNNTANKGQLAKDIMKSGLEVFIGGGRKVFKDRDDKKSLMNQLNSMGYKILEDNKDLKGKSGRKVAGLIDELNIKSINDGRGEYLDLAWLRAFKTLVRNDTGFFMIIDNAHIKWSCQANDKDYLISEILDMDKMLGEILNLVAPDNRTLVIFLSCYESGGLSVTQSVIDKKINYRWGSKQMTAGLSPVFAIGPGAAEFSGIMEIPDIYKKLKKLLE